MNTINKAEIKASITEELKCDYGFIKSLIKCGMIQKLHNAINNPTDSDERKELMEQIYQSYKDYCKAWNMDYNADNRNNKTYLYQ